MKLNGVPAGGKRITLIDGVTVQLPAGAAYGKNTDGDVFFGVLDPKPTVYRDGVFLVPDDATFNWRISGFIENSGLFDDIKLDGSPSERKLAIQKTCDMIVEANSSSEEIKNEPYEFGSSTEVEETEDGMRMTFSPKVSQSCGQGGRYTLNDQTELMIIEKRMSLMGATFSFFIGVIVIDTGKAPLAYQANLSAQEECLKSFENAIIPVLKTVQYDTSARVAADAASPAAPKAVMRNITINPGISDKFSACEFDADGGIPWHGGTVTKFTALNYALLVSCSQIFELHYVGGGGTAGFRIDGNDVAGDAVYNLESERDRICEMLDCYHVLDLPSDRLCEELKKYIERYIAGFSMTMTINGKTTSSQNLTGSILFKMLLRRLYAIEECEKNAYRVYICGQLAMALPEYPDLIYDMIGLLRADSDIQGDYSVQYTVFDGDPEENIYQDYDARHGYDFSEDDDDDYEARHEAVYQKYEAWAEILKQQQKVEDMNHLPFDAVSFITVLGKTFVLTGKFEGYEDRDKIKQMIIARGGRCTTAVSGKTDYVVVGALGDYGKKKIEDVQFQRSTGSGVKLIRQRDLFAALNGKTSAPIAADNSRRNAPNTNKSGSAAAPANPANKSSSASVRMESNKSAEQEGKALADSVRTRTQALEQEFERRAGAQGNVLVNGDYSGMSDPRLKRDLQTMDRIVNDCGAKGERLLNDSLQTFNRIKNSLTPATAALVSSALINLIATVDGNYVVASNIGHSSRYTWKTNIRSVRASLQTGNAAQPKANASSNAKPTSKTKAPAQKKSTLAADDNAKKKKAQQEEAAAKKQAEEARQKDAQKKQLNQMQDQIKTLEQTKAQKEEKLRSLGIFKGAEKKALRKEIESLQNDIATARNKAEKLRILVTAEPVEYNDGPMSDEMKTLVRQLSWELGSGPKTAFELGLTSLHAANAVKHIENVYRVRVTRERTNAKGERRMVEETAYFIK